MERNKTVKQPGGSLKTKPKVPKDKIIIFIVAVLVMLIFILKQNKNNVPQNIPVRENLTEESFSPENAFPEDETAPSAKKVSEKLPQILELGSDSCMPCMMMRPILAELTAEYKGQFAVEFVDVYKNTSIPEKYKIRGIPTQIFLDAQGKEISRNSGFMPKDDILARWKSLGYEFKKNPLPEKQDK